MSKIDYPHYGECDFCLHDGTDKCLDCEHYDQDTYDNWEPVTPEKIAEYEKIMHDKALKEAIHEYIEFDAPEDFYEYFETALKCAAYDHFKRTLMGVFATQDGYLVASNGYLLCEIKCSTIPEALKGRIIISLEDGKAAIHTGKYPKYGDVLNISQLTSIFYDEVVITEEKLDGMCAFEICHLKMRDTSLAIKKIYLDLVNRILQGNIIVYYKPGEPLQPIIFDGVNGKIVICPVRTYQKEG